MRTEIEIEELIDKEFLDKLYGFSYRRCKSSYEAQDLCSEIVLNILKGIRKNPIIKDFYSFAWTIVYRTYADYCDKCTKQRERFIREVHNEKVHNLQTDSIEEYIEKESDMLALQRIKKEMAFLSKMYRDVMVMYYLEEMKVCEIATYLGISENAVKQRLFSARNTLRKEVEKMKSKDLSLTPIQMQFIGIGDPVGNNPAIKAERMLSQNLVYLCKDTARSAKELSEILNVPMPFIEEELGIQCAGLNGQYGLLKKLENDKYIVNFCMLELANFKQIQQMYKKKIESLVERIETYLQKRENEILSFPFLNQQTDIRFIAWSLINLFSWSYIKQMNQCLEEKYFKEIQKNTEKYCTFGIVREQGDTQDLKFYGCDGITGYNICGYSAVSAFNLYGERIQQHFACGHDISNDPLLCLTLKAVKGIKKSELTQDEQETAAKAIEAGYIKIQEGYLYPKVVVMDMKEAQDFQNLALGIEMDFKDLVEEGADELYKIIQKFIPKHLMGDYPIFTMVIFNGIISNLIEGCIEKNILTLPEHTLCAEGTWIMVSN